MKRSEEEIREQIDLAVKNDGTFHGMTFEEGVRYALEWVLGECEEAPMED